MMRAAHRWVLRHDDSKVFVVLYIGLAVVLSIFISLFWLVAVVGVHLLLEIVKQHHWDPRPAGVLARSIWEVKLDLALIVFSFVIELYMGMVLGLAGLGAGARVGTQVAVRFGVWQRVLRGVLLSLDDAAQVARALAARRRGRDAGADEGEPEVEERPLRPERPPTGGPELWGGFALPRWPWGDRLSVAFAVLCVVLVAAAPSLTDHTAASALHTIASQLHPWP